MLATHFDLRVHKFAFSIESRIEGAVEYCSSKIRFVTSKPSHRLRERNLRAQDDCKRSVRCGKDEGPHARKS